MRRQLDSSTCSVLIWECAAALQRRHAWSMGRMSCLYSRTPFLMEKPLLLFRRDPSVPNLCRFLPHLVDMLRPVEPFIKGNSKITGDVIIDRLALLAHSVCMRPSVQGLLWDEFDGLSEDKLKILFLLS